MADGESMSPFDQWVAHNVPHVYHHRDGAFSSSYAAFKRCWDSASRVAETMPGEFIPPIHNKPKAEMGDINQPYKRTGTED